MPRHYDQMGPDRILLADAARQLGIDPRTAQRLARAGKFPGNAARKVGGQWRVSVPLLDKYLHGDREVAT